MRPQLITIKGAWDEKLAGLIDGAFRRVTSILTGLTVRDNVAGSQFVISWNSDRAPILIEWTKPKPPRGVFVMRATEDSADPLNLSGVPTEWIFRNGRVEVMGIGNLAASTDYTVDIVLLED